MSALAKLDRARVDLAEARTLEEIKGIRDIAEAARTYAKAAKLGLETQNYAAEIALLAARKAGEILTHMQKSKGGEHTHRTAASVAAVSEYRQALTDTDTSERTAQHWQRLAAVPAEEVDKYLADVREMNGEITASGLLREAEKRTRVKNRITIFRRAAPTWGRPYYQQDGITLYHADCREVLPNIEGDFLWTDPPYNVCKDYGDTWNDSMPDDEYLEFVTTWTSAAKASCPGVAVYTPQKWMVAHWNALGADYRQVVLSHSASGPIRYGWSSQFTSILTNAKPFKLTPDVWDGNGVLPVSCPSLHRENVWKHPGYTSEKLTRKVLETLCPGGGTVIDPFCGTGTTLRMAKDAGLPAIGIEVSERYCEIAATRLGQRTFAALFHDDEAA